MDKLVVGLLGAFAGLATAGSTQAATAPAASPAGGLTNVASYADLLEPVPNAVELLKADDAARAMQHPADDVQQIDYRGGYYGGYDRGYGPRYEHHHHHHNYGERYGYYRRGPYNHHHHHHHQNYRGRNDFIGIPGVGGFVVGR